MSNKVLGKKVFTELKVGEIYYPIFCAKSAELSLEQEEIETTSINSGSDREYIPGMSSATITCSGVTVLDNSQGQISPLYLIVQSVRRILQDVRMRFIDDDGDTAQLSFRCMIRTIGISRERGSYSKSAVMFRITGGISVGSVPAPSEPVCEVQAPLYLAFAEGETSVQDDLLIEAPGQVLTILEVQREGIGHSFTVGTPGNRQFNFNGATGTISFDPTNPSNGEEIYVLYKIQAI